jgi:hypothetical protein
MLENVQTLASQAVANTSIIVTETSKAAYSTHKKGARGEAVLFDKITSRLMARDGYIVEGVSGQAGSCDIIVHRKGYPGIRLKNRFHNQRVPHHEVKRFLDDMATTQDHGVFVSI